MSGKLVQFIAAFFFLFKTHLAFLISSFNWRSIFSAAFFRLSCFRRLNPVRKSFLALGSNTIDVLVVLFTGLLLPDFVDVDGFLFLTILSTELDKFVLRARCFDHTVY